jgi:hypothetical protein
MPRNRNYNRHQSTKAPHKQSINPDKSSSIAHQTDNSPIRTLSQNLLAGISIGTGSAIAHETINTLVGSNKEVVHTPDNSTLNPLQGCMKYPSREELDLKRCIIDNSGNTWSCQDIFEKYSNYVMREFKMKEI